MRGELKIPAGTGLQAPYTSRFFGTPNLRHISAREAVLTTPFAYRSALALALIIVPVDFVTDGASVPRGFWTFVRPFGRLLRPAIIHDWLYVQQSISDEYITRDLADEIFLEGMEVDSGEPWNIDWATRRSAYRLVRLFGREAWET